MEKTVLKQVTTKDSESERLALFQKEQALVEAEAASQERRQGIKPYVVKINLPK